MNRQVCSSFNILFNAYSTKFITEGPYDYGTNCDVLELLIDKDITNKGGLLTNTKDLRDFVYHERHMLLLAVDHQLTQDVRKLVGASIQM